LVLGRWTFGFFEGVQRNGPNECSSSRKNGHSSGIFLFPKRDHPLPAAIVSILCLSLVYDHGRSDVKFRWTRAPNLVSEAEHESGGPFAAYQQPQELVNDLRNMFGKKGSAFGVVAGKTGY